MYLMLLFPFSPFPRSQFVLNLLNFFPSVQIEQCRSKNKVLAEKLKKEKKNPYNSVLTALQNKDLKKKKTL